MRCGWAYRPSHATRTNVRHAPRGFKDATSNPAALRRLWRKYPEPLVGVPTGKVSGLFVVDIDSGKHVEAGEWLERNSPRLPDTRHHRTKSGGLHLLFKYRAGLKSTASKLAPGVDTRGDGDYVIWWPFCLELWADHHFGPLAEMPTGLRRFSRLLMSPSLFGRAGSLTNPSARPTTKCRAFSTQ